MKDLRTVPWLLDDEEPGSILANAGSDGHPTILTVDVNRDWPDHTASQLAEHIVLLHNAALTTAPPDMYPAPCRMHMQPNGGCGMEMFLHLDDSSDGLDMRMIAIAHGFELQFVDFETTADEALQARYEDGEPILHDWHPTAMGDDWELALKQDSDDGPFAWFARPVLTDHEPVSLERRRAIRLELADKIIEQDRSRRAFAPDVEGRPMRRRQTNSRHSGSQESALHPTSDGTSPDPFHAKALRLDELNRQLTETLDKANARRIKGDPK